MSDSKNLSLSEYWDLVKYFFVGVWVCGLIFLAPYYLFSAFDLDFVSSESRKYLNYIFYGVVLVYVVKHLDGIFEWFENFFSKLKQQVKGVSLFKKTLWFLFLFLWFFGCINYTIIAMHIGVLVLIPAGFTYDRYIAHKQGIQKLLTDP